MSIFTQIRVPKVKRTAFNLSHNVKMTADFGKLYPIFCEPVVPGDTFKLSTSIFMRMAPMIAPMMSRCDIYVHYFFVPNRLIWDGWKDFITGGEDGDSNRLYPRLAVNALNSSLFKTGTLADYLGFPVMDYKNPTDDTPSSATIDGRKLGANAVIDALPFRAYQLIYNEYYRDQNVTEEIDIFKSKDGLTGGAMTGNLMNFRFRAWKKDYFTSALPFPQRGEDVFLPLSGDAKLEYPATGLGVKTYRDPEALPFEQEVTDANLGTDLINGPLHSTNDHLSQGDRNLILDTPTDSKGNDIYRILPPELQKLNVDLSKVNSATINELRNAFAAQRYLEAMARGGSRYIEQIYSIFGVRSSDGRLQRPEYLGGGKQPIVVSDVLQTSSTVESTVESDVQTNSPQGNQSGVGASAGKAASFKRFFEEHGYVMGILSVIPKASYQQGMPRKYLKTDRFDYYWPQFAHLGEQEIMSQELYFNPAAGTTSQEATFGYTPRYAEYKFCPDTVHGDFRNSLLFWHLGRVFNRAPGLNQEFIECKPNVNRIFAVNEFNGYQADHLYFNIQHSVRALRPMPKFGTPK